MGKDYRTKNEKLYDKLDETTKSSWSYSDFVSKTNDVQKAALRANPLGRDVTNEINAGKQLYNSAKETVNKFMDDTTKRREMNEDTYNKLKKSKASK